MRSAVVWILPGAAACAAVLDCTIPLTGQLDETDTGRDAMAEVGAVPMDARIDVGTGDASADGGPSNPDAGKDARTDGRPDAADACPPILTSDNKNCGTCGHDCLGGACMASVCQPFTIVLATGQANPLGIAVDATAIYWVNENGGVMKLAK